MSQIVCPHCDGRFSSKKDLTGRSVRCPRCDESFVVEEASPRPRRSTAKAAPPPAAAAPPKVSRVRDDTKRSSRSRTPKKKSSGGAAIPLAIAAVVVVGGGLLWFGLPLLNSAGFVGNSDASSSSPSGDANSSESGETGFSFHPFSAFGGDTAESLAAEISECAVDLRERLSTVQDTTSADAAVTPVLDIGKKLMEIQRRAAKAEPVPKEKLNEIIRQANVDSDTEGLQAEINRIAESNVASDDLKGVLLDMSFVLRSVVSTIRYGLQEIPKPQGDYEQLEYDRTMLHRNAMQAVLAVSDADDVAVAVKELNADSDKLRELAERKASLEGAQMQFVDAEHKYLAFYLEFEKQMDRHAAMLQEGGMDVASLRSALAGMSTADSTIAFARMPSQQTRPADGSMPANGNPGIPGGGRSPFGPGSRGVPTGRPPGPATGPAGPDEIIVVVQSQVFSRTAEGAEEVREMLKAKSELSRQLQQSLKKLVGPGRSSGRITGGTCEIRLSYSGDPQALADQIDFGTVESVDGPARRIDVSLPE